MRVTAVGWFIAFSVDLCMKCVGLCFILISLGYSLLDFYSFDLNK